MRIAMSQCNHLPKFYIDCFEEKGATIFESNILLKLYTVT